MDYTIDAAGETHRFISITPIEPEPGQPILDEYAVTLDVTQSFDGNGMAVKKIAANTVHGSQGGDQTTTHTTYLLRSTVLGGTVMAEIGSESEQRSFVYLGGEVLAVQNRSNQTVMWEYRDPGNASVRMTTSNGTVGSEGNAELDPLGSDAGLSAPPAPSPAQYWKIYGYPGLGPATSSSCMMDFIPTPCSEVGRAVNNGSAVLCPNNSCSPRPIIVNERDGADPMKGWAVFTGNGYWLSDGNSSASIFLDDLQEGSALDAMAYSFTSDKRDKKKRRRRPLNPTTIVAGVSVVNEFNITIEHLDDNKEKLIRSVLEKLFSDKCSEAFRSNHLSAPIDQAKIGLTIRPASDLFGYSASQLGILREKDHQTLKNNFSGSAFSVAQAGTIPGSMYGVQLTTGYHTQIYLGTHAFNGEGWFSGFSLQDVMAHEFIHGAGWNGENSNWGHDLSHFDAHDRILEACR